MKLTVIVPIYNAEKYLSMCLDEIMTCPITEMECLLVNDGSTDTSLLICENYAKKDSRFKIINKPNEGVSVTRNIGIAHATGEYVMFLDADDYINSKKWKDIIDAINLELDFIAFSYYTLYQDGRVTEELFDISSKSSNDVNSMRKILLGTAALNTCWGKLFRTNAILTNNIQFREGLKTGEDAIFILDYLKVANNVLLVNESVLFYRQHGESVMHKLDIHSKIQDFRELFDSRKRISTTWNNSELEAVMYREFFSVITNLLLIYSYKNKFSECNKVIAQVLKEDMVQDILTNVNPVHLRSFYKRLEFQLLNYSNIMLMSSYFKIKSLFLREAGN